MADIRLPSLIFDQGIENITYARQQIAAPMPERGETPPPDVRVHAQLDQLLQRPSMDSRLDEALRPLIANRDLLLAARFRETLRKLLAQLRKAAGSATKGSERARVLNRAVRLLSDELDLRELEQMYRSALYQG